jgi:hypothetical protein
MPVSTSSGISFCASSEAAAAGGQARASAATVRRHAS